MDIRIALFLLATVRAAAGFGGTTVDEFEKAAAASQKFLDLGCVLYDRERDCSDQAGAALVCGGYPSVDLEALTSHRDPRVRTLALVCLFGKEDPKLLPLIFRLVEDPAPTFPARAAVAYAYNSRRPGAFNEIPQTPQTVGSVAETMLSFYLERAGYSYGSRGTNNCLGFPDYWAQRKDRAHLASWFTVQLDRATQGTSPIPGNRERPFAALRSQLNAIEGEDASGTRCLSEPTLKAAAGSSARRSCWPPAKRSAPTV